MNFVAGEINFTNLSLEVTNLFPSPAILSCRNIKNNVKLPMRKFLTVEVTKQYRQKYFEVAEPKPNKIYFLSIIVQQYHTMF